MALTVTSPSFQHMGSIPSRHTCDGDDVSPELNWSGAPENTKGFALICDDPDAPMGTFVHWVLYGLSSKTTQLPEGLSRDSELSSPECRQGTSDFRRTGYGGPCPPSGEHRYFFKLYALDAEIELSAGARKQELLDAMQGHILEQAELIGTYRRK